MIYSHCSRCVPAGEPVRRMSWLSVAGYSFCTSLLNKLLEATKELLWQAELMTDSRALKAA